MYHEFPPAYYSLLERRDEAVLLETSRFDERNHRSYLFLEPVRIIEAHALDDIPLLIETVEKHAVSGGFSAGFFMYECGYAFERIAPLRMNAQPLAHFGLYDRVFTFDHKLGRFVTQSPEEAGFTPGTLAEEEYSLSDLRLAIGPDDYARAIGTVKEHIREGDTYQINFTTKYHFTFDGSPLALYQDLRRKQRVAYAAFLHTGDNSIISLSPELFFRMEGNAITAKPMKGTARRGRTSQEDRRISRWLHEDEKNRAENVMIVDLLRNDLGRIAEPGSVKVSDLFAVERYETLFQMTSTIDATIPPGTPLTALFRSIFPSGSVTGAPKIRSMQIIHGLEQEARGVYTGALGYVGPERTAAFNVAIRTITIANGSGEMGVGSGIVFDSVAGDEFSECVLKGKFLTEPPEDFALIESLLWSDAYPLIERHLERLKSSAEYFDFAFDADRLRQALNAVMLAKGTRYKVRLLLRRDGACEIEPTVITPPVPGAPQRVMIAHGMRTSSADKFFYHKTTRRTLYDRAHREAEQHRCSDAILLNEKGEVTEGAISNIFIRRGRELLTPPVSCGLLNGVYRQHLMSERRDIREEVLHPEDLASAEQIFLCNAVRGMWEVSLAESTTKQESV